MNNKCFIRFDAGKEIGLGHWYRCIALCQDLKQKGVETIALIHQPSKMFRQEMDRLKISYLSLQHIQNKQELILLHEKYNVEHLILDLIKLDETFVKEINFYFTTFCIGGSGKGLDWVHFRIEGMLPRKGHTQNFHGKKLYVGTKYIIIREFFCSNNKFIVRHKLENVLITLGGDANANGYQIAVFLKKLFPEMNITVLLGKLAKETEPKSGIIVSRNIENPVPLMLNVDLAICSGGMTMFELCYLGVPFIILPQVSLQEKIAVSFNKQGLADFISLEKQTDKKLLLENLCKKLNVFQTKSYRENFCNRIKKLVDGKGLERVSGIIKEKIIQNS